MIFPKEQFVVHTDDSVLYINYCKRIINDIQNNSKIPSKEVYLSFYPPAKNVRFCSSYMTQNILSGYRSVISNNSRSGEDSFWNQVTGDNWFPWLWARTRVSGNYTNNVGWNYYFDSFSDKQIVFEKGDSKEPPPDMLPFYMYLACLNYTFTFNQTYVDLMNKYKSEMKWPEDKKVLAIQIRRGELMSTDETCIRYINERPYHTTEQYIEKADILLQKNPSLEYVYISTDSDQEIEKIRKIRPDWKILNLPIDRRKFYRYDKNDIVKDDSDLDLEKICAKNPDRIPFTTDSAFTDLYFIAISSALVSTLTMSEFSRCGWFLQISKNGTTPYINMDDKSITLSDIMLL